MSRQPIQRMTDWLEVSLAGWSRPGHRASHRYAKSDDATVESHSPRYGAGYHWQINCRRSNDHECTSSRRINSRATRIR